MLRINEILIVEGKYDAAKLANIVDTVILTTGGFSIYKDDEKKALIKTLGKKRGIVILTDSDAAGFQIRHYIENIAGGIPVKHAYIPEIAGKEKRKTMPSKEGTLGVEGIPDETIIKALVQSGVTTATPKLQTSPITYTHLYELGLSGTAQSGIRRRTLLQHIGLPQKISKKGLVSVLNNLYTLEELQSIATEKPALFFDFHGTLIYPNNPWIDGAYELVTQYFPEENIAKETIDRELHGKCLPWLEIPSRDTRCLENQGGWWAFCTARFTEMFVRAGLPQEKAETIAPKIREYVLQPACHVLYPEAVSTLQTLKDRGYKCYMVSNNFPEMQTLCETLGIDTYFEEILVSAKAGYAKPRKEFFDLAKQAAQNPVYSVMIGDNPKDDIDGAKKEGFITVQVERYPRSENADFYCNSLQDLLELFQ